MTLRAEAATPAAFRPFGRLLTLGPGGEGVVPTDGPGWSDAYTAAPLLGQGGSLGMTRTGGGGWQMRQMERHPNTDEALFCGADPILLAVAPGGPAAAPRAGEVRAFVLVPGQVAVLLPGTWHDACRGLDRPTAYYWMATVGTGTEWVDLVPGPLQILPPEERP